MKPAVRLAVYGDINLDVLVLYHEAAAPGSDSRATVRLRGGGSAANVAVWAAREGADVAFFGQVGDDAAGRWLREELAAEGVAVDPPQGNLAVSPGSATGLVVVSVRAGERTMATDRGANLTPVTDLVPREALVSREWVHLTGYSFFEPGPREVALRALEVCRELGLPFSVDPSSVRPLRDYGAECFLEDVAGTEVVFPNLDEARELTGLDDPEEVARALARRFPVVALTLGAQGCLVAAAGRVGAVPAASPPGPAVDPTGAGDAFAAGFLTRYAAGRRRTDGRRFDLALEAAAAAVRVAARAVTVVGGRGEVGVGAGRAPEAAGDEEAEGPRA